jgi:hypothetical protein
VTFLPGALKATVAFTTSAIAGSFKLGSVADASDG